MADLVVGDSILSEELANKLGIGFVKVETIKYSEGEIKTKLDIKTPNELTGKDVLICLSKSRSSADANDYIVKASFVINTLKDLKVNTVDIVLPYLNYARQEKQYLVGEPVSLAYSSKLYDGVSRIFVINSHLFGKNDLKKYFPDHAIFDVDCTPVFADFFEKHTDNPVVVGPDEGSLHLVKSLSKNIICEFYVLAKTRDTSTGKIEITPNSLNVTGKDVIIYDDLTSTGSTLKATYDIIEKLNPKNIDIAVIHLWGKAAIEKLSKLSKVRNIVTSNTFTTDSNLGKIIELSIADFLANYIKKIYR